MQDALPEFEEWFDIEGRHSRGKWELLLER